MRTIRKLAPAVAPAATDEAQEYVTQKAAALPLVEIIGARLLGETGTETGIEVMLSLNATQTTTIRDWSLEMTASYADGTTHQVSSWDSRRLQNRLVCLVPTRSERGDEASLSSYQAKLAVNFTTVSSIILRKEFAMPRPLDGAREHPAALIKERPRFAILDARPVEDGTPGREAIDVRWVANAPEPAVINRFDVELKVKHTDGTIRRVCKSVSGVQHQVRLTIASPGADVASIKVGLGATFTWFGSISVTKAGTLHTCDERAPASVE